MAHISKRSLGLIYGTFLASVSIFGPTKVNAIEVIPNKLPLAEDVRCKFCIKSKKLGEITFEASAKKVYGFKVTPSEIADLGGWIKNAIEGIIGFFASTGGEIKTTPLKVTRIDGLDPNWTSVFQGDGSVELLATNPVVTTGEYPLFDNIAFEGSLPEDTIEVLGIKLISTAFGSSGATETSETAYVPFELSIDDATECPTPLPILGIFASLGFSRKLRKRINNSKPEVGKLI